ncbi:DsbA family protein, partial [Mesorhizobium sp. M2D.F.Ca.ET.145.01.1.1]
DALEAKQKEEQRLAALGVIKNAKDQIFNSTFDGVVGNPNGKVTIVEFYDYNCGFCKRAIEDMRALTKSDPDLRFVLKEFPILGPDSQKASVVSMAFHLMMPEKYGEFHTALLGGQGRATEATAIKIALSL